MTDTTSSRLARLRLLAATVAIAGTGLALEACQSPSTPPEPHDLAVVLTPPQGPFTAGMTITWTATVTNKGPGDSGPVILGDTTGATCAASGNAKCPTTAAPGHVDNIPNGGKLTFTFTRTLPADGLGIPALTMSASSDFDSDPTDDSASYTVPVDDSRSGTYRMYGADGRAYDITLDFPHATWAVAGNGADATGTLTSEMVDGTPVYLFGNSGRFHTLSWGLVGEADLGGGPASFVASRLFATAIYYVDHLSFNVATRDWNAGATPTGIETWAFSGTTLTRCVDAVPWIVADCPAGSTSTYDVTSTGNDFTAVNRAAADDALHFRIVDLGSTWYLASAESDAAGVRHFRFGMPDNAGPTAATWLGGDTLSHWNEIVIGSDGTWQLTRPAPDDSGPADSATFATAGASAPAGLRLSTRASDGGSLYLATSDQLGMLVGTPAGPAAGYLMMMAR